MINITEQKSKKVPGETSLFVQFEYDPQLISLIKEGGTAIFDKKDKLWEIPISSLQQFVDKAVEFEDIN